MLYVLEKIKDLKEMVGENFCDEDVKTMVDVIILAREQGVFPIDNDIGPSDDLRKRIRDLQDIKDLLKIEQPLGSGNGHGDLMKELGIFYSSKIFLLEESHKLLKKYDKFLKLTFRSVKTQQEDAGGDPKKIKESIRKKFDDLKANWESY